MPTWPARTRAATPASSTARRRARGRIATVTERTPAVTATRVSRRRSTSETRRSGSSIATPHVMAWVEGHSHENKITPLRRTGGGYWEIKSPAVADWSTHYRLLDPPPPARLDGQPRRDAVAVRDAARLRSVDLPPAQRQRECVRRAHARVDRAHAHLQRPPAGPGRVGGHARRPKRRAPAARAPARGR